MSSKRLLALLMIVAGLAMAQYRPPSGGGGSTPTVTAYAMQSIVVRGTSTVMPSASVAGDIMAVCIGWEGGAATNATLADNKGNTYTRRAQATGNGNENIALFTAQIGATPGTLTLTGTFPASAGFEGIAAIELAGIAIADAIDGTPAAASGSGNQSVSTTTTQAGDAIVICNQGDSSSGIVLPKIGYTFEWTNASDSGGIGLQMQPTAGLITGYLRNSSSNNASAIMAIKAH